MKKILSILIFSFFGVFVFADTFRVKILQNVEVQYDIGEPFIDVEKGSELTVDTYKTSIYFTDEGGISGILAGEAGKNAVGVRQRTGKLQSSLEKRSGSHQIHRSRHHHCTGSGKSDGSALCAGRTAARRIFLWRRNLLL